MKIRPYNDRDALSFAYSQTVDHFGMWVLIVLIESVSVLMRFGAWIPFLGMAATSFFGTAPFQVHVAQDVFDFSWFQASFKLVVLAILLGLVFELIGGISDMGITRIRLDLFEAKKSGLSQLLSCANLAFKHFAATFLYWGMVLIGLGLFIVPGIIFAVRFGFYRSAMVEKQCGPLTALKESFGMTCGFFKPLVTTYFLWGVLLLPFFNMRAFPFAGFVTFPFLGLANIFVYKALIAQKKD